jgi:deferrochelatase/peroxidase EfeB
VDRDDIQGLVFSSYSRLRASTLLKVRFDGGDANAWLRRVLPSVSSGSRGQRFAAFQLNLAFTARGLSALGLSEATLAEFSVELREGMAEPARSRALGDVGPNAPSGWEFGATDASIPDALLLAYAENGAALATRLDELRKSLDRYKLEATELPTFLRADGCEHFGSRLGVSEPRFRGSGRGRAFGPRLAAGEFLLGHKDGSGRKQRGPSAPRLTSTREPPPLVDLGRRVDLGFNGSYLVLRQLEQRVGEFRANLDAAEANGTLRELAQARLVGRWANGASLTLHPDAQPSECPPERFRYDDIDPDGRRCPLDAHVRRANPRGAVTADGSDPDRHRLLRRGRLYGGVESSSAASEERGLLFVALNADIARQFEHVQGRFLNGKSFFDWARVRGGVYAFLPSLSALGYLADLGQRAR